MAEEEDNYQSITAREKDRRKKMEMKKVLHDCLKRLIIGAISAPTF